MTRKYLYIYGLVLLLSSVICQSHVFASDRVDMANPRIASWYLEDDVIRVDTKAKTITIPNSLVVMAGDNQSKTFGFSGGAIFSYDVKDEGNACKVVFNPSKWKNDDKFTVVAREHPLTADEYYFCGIVLDPFMLDVPAEKVVIDGRHPLKNKDKGRNSIIYYDGEKLSISLKPKKALSCMFVGEKTLVNDIRYGDKMFYAQGMAIYNKYMFRISYENSAKKTLCQIFDISNLNNPRLISRYYMAYNEGCAHANCCQFGDKVYSKSGFPLLYIRNGDRHACIVERVTLKGSEVVQRIDIDYKGMFAHGGGEGNAIIGDDGYIWYFGENNGFQYFAKFKRPSLSSKHVTLTSKNAVDHWEQPVTDGYENRIWQGGKVKGGKLYFLYGGSLDANRLYVIDIKTKKQVSLIPLSSIIEEVEDLDFGDNYMLIGISAPKNGVYQINNIAN